MVSVNPYGDYHEDYEMTADLVEAHNLYRSHTVLHFTTLGIMTVCLSLIFRCKVVYYNFFLLTIVLLLTAFCLHFHCMFKSNFAADVITLSYVIATLNRDVPKKTLQFISSKHVFSFLFLFTSLVQFVK